MKKINWQDDDTRAVVAGVILAGSYALLCFGIMAVWAPLGLVLLAVAPAIVAAYFFDKDGGNKMRWALCSAGIASTLVGGAGAQLWAPLGLILFSLCTLITGFVALDSAAVERTTNVD